MKPSEMPPSETSPERLDGLLAEFFRRELPESLPPLDLRTAVAGRVSSGDAGRPPRPNRALVRWVTSGLAAAAMLALALWVDGVRFGLLDRANPTAPEIVHWPPSEPPGDLAEAEPEDPGWQWYVVDGERPVERVQYVSESLGRVEQRTNVRWRSVFGYDPRTGVHTQRTVPGWDIEILPVKN